MQALANKRMATHGRATARPAVQAARLRAQLRVHALAAGEQLPSFKALTDSNATVSSSDLVKDHGAVIFVYPQACTSGCTFQALGFKDNLSAFEAKGYKVYGMSADPVDAQVGWKQQHGFPYTLLSDLSKDGLKVLGCLTEAGTIKRAHFVVAKGGKVEDAQIGVGSKDSVPKALAFVAAK